MIESRLPSIRFSSRFSMALTRYKKDHQLYCLSMRDFVKVQALPLGKIKVHSSSNFMCIILVKAVSNIYGVGVAVGIVLNQGILVSPVYAEAGAAVVYTGLKFGILTQ